MSRQLEYSHTSGKKHIIVAERDDGSFHKLFQIRIKYGPNASLVVDFPYTPWEPGILHAVRDEIGGRGVGTVQIFDDKREFALTDNRPKYHHHIDGKAHFSQDGRVLTAIGRRACPLLEINGHAFTLYIQGYQDFPRMTESDAVSRMRRGERLIPIKTSRHDRILTVVGRVFSSRAIDSVLLKTWMASRTENKITHFIDRYGYKSSRCFLAGSPYSRFTTNSFLVDLELSRYVIPNQTMEKAMIFMGGFDPLAPVKIQDPPGFLMARYPATDNTRDLSQLRWIDLRG